jgi:hypothetical protein
MAKNRATAKRIHMQKHHVEGPAIIGRLGGALFRRRALHGLRLVHQAFSV